jgi:hypothetical protein
VPGPKFQMCRPVYGTTPRVQRPCRPALEIRRAIYL